MKYYMMKKNLFLKSPTSFLSLSPNRTITTIQLVIMLLAQYPEMVGNSSAIVQNETYF
jgi:hypothetical protein